VTSALPLGLLLSAGIAVLALAIVVAGALSLETALLLVPATVAGALVVLMPFYGLLMLVLLAQLDTVANQISQFLPVSAFKLLTAATIAGWFFNSYRLPRDQRLGPSCRELRYVTLFALWIVFTFLICVHKGPGLDHMVGFLSTMLLLYLVVLMTDTPARLEALVWTLVLSGAISAAVILLDTLLGVRLLSTSDAATTARFDGVARSAGASDYNPTTAAHMLLATTFIAIVLLIEHPRLRWLSGAAAAVGVVALVFTLARSAAVAFAIVAAIYAWRNRRHRLFPLALMTMLALALAAAPFVPELFWERMATLLNIEVDRTLLRRISYNLIGIELFWQHPITGVGPGNFPYYYDDPEFRWYPGREPVPRQLHNSYLETAVEFGVIGLALFLAIVFSALRAALAVAAGAARAVATPANALAYAFGAFLVASVFMPNEDTKFMWILPGLCVAVREIARRETDAAPALR